jgi:sulfur carrier protein ThiS
MSASVEFDNRLLLSPLPSDVGVENSDHHTVILHVPAGKSINQTLKDLNITLTQAVSAIVNGQTTDLEKPLEQGDQVRLLPQIAGGD